ncbi:MAG: acyl carrier protein [Maritimibacter sp.]|nr:acyl carrier protein [Maritimibacter sp.]
MQDIDAQDLKAFIEKDVRAFIAENLTFSDDPDELDAEVSMLEADIIDSTSILELVSYLEERFGIDIDDDDMVPANLDSLNRIAAFVAARLEAQPGSIDLAKLRQAS